MPLFSSLCAAALQLSAPCPAAPVPLPDAELTDVHGTAIAAVGLDPASAAAGATSLDSAVSGVRVADEMREIFDNWHVMVAVPLIADAMARAPL